MIKSIYVAYFTLIFFLSVGFIACGNKDNEISEIRTETLYKIIHYRNDNLQQTSIYVPAIQQFRISDKEKERQYVRLKLNMYEFRFFEKLFIKDLLNCFLLKIQTII